MKLKSLALALIACQHVASHTLFTTLFVNDVNQGDGTCVRQPQDSSTATNPVIDLQSKEMMCGFDGERPVDRVCSVPRAAKLSFLYRTWPDGSQPGSIDPSHKGPCAVYMKAQGIPGDWFKIWDEGYDEKTSQWCTEKLIKNKGLLSIKIPGNLRGGSYLVRSELLSLHEADKNPPQPQFYIGCAQIFLNSSEAALPSDTVKIPGHVNIKDPSMLYDIYNYKKLPYPLPGPKRYVSGSSAFTKIEAEKRQMEGLLPANAILTNGNWWGVEVPGYTGERGCRMSADSCWSQLDKCYNSAPPSGNQGCRIWEDKCTAINDNCNTPNPKGPSNAGKVLGISQPSYSIPAAQDVDVVATTPQLPTVPTTFISIASTPPNTTPTKKSNSAASRSHAAKVLFTTISAPPSTIPTQAQQAVSQILSSPPTLSVNTTSQLTSSPFTVLVASTTGRCGIEGGETTCTNSQFGRCCSMSSHCGSTIDHCGGGKCQSAFGECGDWIPVLEKKAARNKHVKEILDRILRERKSIERRRTRGRF